MPAETTPTRVTIRTDEQVVTIDWADGHQSVLSLDKLRRACPCAECRERAKQSPISAPSQTWTDVQAEPVGSYGLRFTWDDGHNAGIYTWQRLRALGKGE